MNVSKQELDALTRAVITEVSWAQDRVAPCVPSHHKDDMELAKQHIFNVLVSVIGFRDKYGLPAIVADEPYREQHKQARQKKLKALLDRFAANQQDIERLQQHNNRIQAELDKLQQEAT